MTAVTAMPAARLGLTAAVILSMGIPGAVARAQNAPDQRPKEADIFAAPQPAADPAKPAAPEAPAAASTPGGDARDEAVLGAAAGSQVSAETAPEDPLKLGGMFYLRAQSTALQGQAPKDFSLSSPSLVDAYFDARPNDRVRGFVLGRMQFDPTLPASASTAQTMNLGTIESSGASMGTAPLSSLFSTRTRGPQLALDQMWLRFDIKRTVFVTAGKQHARWGTARFWTPTDFLHVRRRNPLDLFDARAGTTMLKLHMPWEARGWNFYAYGVTEGPDATSTVGQVAGAARAEVVLGQTELGGGALVQRGRKPKLAVDGSTGLGDFDFYGELALRYGSEIDRVRYDDAAAMPSESAGSGLERLAATVDLLYPATRDRGLRPQAVGGVTWQRQYADKDVLNFGAEYFYNSLSYDGPAAYPGLVLPRPRPLAEPASFFYLGRHYAAVFVSAPAPYSWDYTTFTLSTIGNLSDNSFITRLDYSLLMLTHLRFEAFVAVRYGTKEGEFRFGVDDLTIGGLTYSRAPGLLDMGVALRVGL